MPHPLLLAADDALELPGFFGKPRIMSGSFSFEAPHVIAEQGLPIHRYVQFGWLDAGLKLPPQCAHWPSGGTPDQHDLPRNPIQEGSVTDNSPTMNPAVVASWATLWRD
jgi:hypothetical protein